MKYFFDTEFIEGFHKPLFGKRRHFIDLISIGIVAEDGREYYAISNEFNPNDADKWVKENVIGKLERKSYVIGGMDIAKEQGHDKLFKSNITIAQEIVQFVHQPIMKKYDDGMSFRDDILNAVYDSHADAAPMECPHEFYAYYSDYDWVLFCSLFGRMIDLPKGFPMMCIDLKQTLDDKVSKKEWYYGRDIWSNTRIQGDDKIQEGDRLASFEEKLDKMKRHDNYPKQTNEHNALADAKWNLELYKFLQTL